MYIYMYYFPSFFLVSRVYGTLTSETCFFFFLTIPPVLRKSTHTNALSSSILLACH